MENHAYNAAGRIDGEKAKRLALLAMNARAALDSDLSAVRGYLDEIWEVLGLREPVDENVALISVTTDNKASYKGGLTPWQLRQVMARIESKLGAPIPLKELSDVSGLSYSYFSRAFKATTGEAPRDFIVKKRLRRAQILLLSTNDALSSVACACGFSDQAHFTRQFRRSVGETPLRWRRAWKRDGATGIHG